MELNMNDRLTAYEVSRRIGKDVPLLIEALALKGDIIKDLPLVPCNRGEIHEVLIRDTYPKPEARGYNMGAGSAATQTRTVTEGLMMLSEYAWVDKKLADASGDAAGLRHSEAAGILTGMGHQINEIAVYGNKAKNPYEINGLAARYKSSAKDPRHVINFGGTPADGLTSIYVCAIGTKLLHLIYNKHFGSGAAIEHSDRGVQDFDVGNGKMLMVYLSHFTTQFGLAVEHPDSVFRIASVPTAAAYWGAADGKDKRTKLIDTVLHCKNMLPSEAQTTCLYCSLDVQEIIEKAGRENEAVVKPDTDPWGNPVQKIGGMRMRRLDVIRNDEAAV
jgi:hypothetical protein